MNLFVLHTDIGETDIAEYSHYSLWGEIYVEVDGRCFPGEEWYDIASSILDMWLQNLIELLRGKKRQRLYFMDGPYWMDAALHGDVCELSFSKENVTYSVSTYQFIQEVITQGRELVELARTRCPDFWNSHCCRNIQKNCRVLSEQLEDYLQS